MPASTIFNNSVHAELSSCYNKLVLNLQHTSCSMLDYSCLYNKFNVEYDAPFDTSAVRALRSIAISKIKYTFVPFLKLVIPKVAASTIALVLALIAICFVSVLLLFIFSNKSRVFL